MRKLLSIILAVTLVMATVIPAADISYAAESKITYEINGSTMYIKGSGPMEDYARADDVPWAYERGISSGIKQIVVEEGITHIGDNALARFSRLESVVIPSTVESIGCRAFELNTMLKSITLPVNVTTIGERAFFNCFSLSSVTTEGLQGAVPGNAFSNCTSLKTVSLNEGVTSIEKYGFINCEALTSVTMPASVKRVEVDAFDADVAITCKDSKLVKFGQNAYRYLQSVDYDVYQNYDYAYRVLELVNIERKAVGLEPLKWDPVLMDAAMQRAGELVILFSHTRPNSGSCVTISPYLTGENAAAGQNTPESVVESWMSSPGHRQNILMKSWKSLGVGCVVHDGRYRWIQCFGMEHSGKSQSLPTNKTVTQTTSFSVEPFFYENIIKQMEEITLKPDIRIDSSTLNKDSTCTASVYVTGYNHEYDEVYDVVKVKNTGINWSSSNTDIATVSSSGEIQAIAPGMTTIKAEMSHYTLEKTITVSCGDDHCYAQTSLTKATTSRNGSIEYRCSSCGETKTENISRINTVKLSATTLTYNGKVRKPTVKVTNNKGEIISRKYYTVTYPQGRKKVGTYKVKITFNGHYKGTIYRAFKINPPKTYIMDLDGKSKAIKVKWKKKTAQTSGYQIRYSTSSSFKTKFTKTVKVKGYGKNDKTIKSLKKDKKYYVKVRTYKIVDGKYYYSPWSKKKTVKTK